MMMMMIMIMRIMMALQTNGKRADDGEYDADDDDDDTDGGDDDDDTFSNHGGHAGSEAPLRFVAYQDLTPIRRLPPMSMQSPHTLRRRPCSGCIATRRCRTCAAPSTARKEDAARRDVQQAEKHRWQDTITLVQAPSLWQQASASCYASCS